MWFLEPLTELNKSDLNSEQTLDTMHIVWPHLIQLYFFIWKQTPSARWRGWPRWLKNNDQTIVLAFHAHHTISLVIHMQRIILHWPISLLSLSPRLHPPPLPLSPMAKARKRHLDAGTGLERDVWLRHGRPHRDVLLPISTDASQLRPWGWRPPPGLSQGVEVTVIGGSEQTHVRRPLPPPSISSSSCTNWSGAFFFYFHGRRGFWWWDLFPPQSKVEIRNSFLLQQVDWSWIWNATNIVH
jgi:hypothetical protein